MSFVIVGLLFFSLVPQGVLLAAEHLQNPAVGLNQEDLQKTISQAVTEGVKKGVKEANSLGTFSKLCLTVAASAGGYCLYKMYRSRVTPQAFDEALSEVNNNIVQQRQNLEKNVQQELRPVNEGADRIQENARSFFKSAGGVKNDIEDLHRQNQEARRALLQNLTRALEQQGVIINESHQGFMSNLGAVQGILVRDFLSVDMLKDARESIQSLRDDMSRGNSAILNELQLQNEKRQVEHENVSRAVDEVARAVEQVSQVAEQNDAAVQEICQRIFQLQQDAEKHGSQHEAFLIEYQQLVHQLDVQGESQAILFQNLQQMNTGLDLLVANVLNVSGSDEIHSRKRLRPNTLEFSKKDSE